MVLKIHDCSINEESNKSHIKSNLGPVENDIIKDLKKYSIHHNCIFVKDYRKSDIILTNTTYPENILEWSVKNNIPKVKRMDGIYWRNNIKEKNIKLNKSSTLSDKVIFISEFSQRSYHKLYGDKLKSENVVLNNADDSIFYNQNLKKEDFYICSSATNWTRKEKRFSTLISLADRIDDKILLIGESEIKHRNIINLGYIKDQKEVNKVLNKSSVFFSPFFRCAGSKVTCQAIKCEIPILYANSGGLPEIVKDNGIMINDYEEIDFLDTEPELDVEEIISKYKEIKKFTFKSKSIPYKETIKNYFDIIKNVST